MTTLKAVAKGVWQLDGFPAHAMNSFFADGILFDCRTRWSARPIARQLRGMRVSVIALTHAHPDHWGAAPELSRKFDVPVAVHHADAGVVTGRDSAGSQLAFWMGKRFLEAGACRNVIALQEGDVVGDFKVVHAPGHSAGHVVFFRESDGVAVTGDLFSTMHAWTRRRELAEPPSDLSSDAEENRRSIQKLVELRPSVVLPGHGPALTDVRGLARFAKSLAAAPARERSGTATG